MKSGEKDKVEIIRFAQSFIKQQEKDKNMKSAMFNELRAFAQKMKKRDEAIEAFYNQKQMDIVWYHLNIIKKYTLQCRQ